MSQAHGEGTEAATETLREALALWRGPPLADLDDRSPAPERAQLEEQRASALEQRIDAELELGRHAELLPELEALVREDPLRERRRAQLMLALYRSGRQADALDVYRSGGSCWPTSSASSRAWSCGSLEKGILEQDPSLAAPAASAVTSRAADAPKARRHSLGSRGRSDPARGRDRRRSSSRSRAARTRSWSSRTRSRRRARRRGEIEADVPIGGRPVAIAVGEGAVWVANADQHTLSGSTPKSRKVVATIGGLGNNVCRRRRRLRLSLGGGRQRRDRWSRVDPNANAAGSAGRPRRVATRSCPNPSFW